MYRCKCGYCFDEPFRREWYEHHGEFIEPMSMDVCPYCGEQDYEEVNDEDI